MKYFSFEGLVQRQEYWATLIIAHIAALCIVAVFVNSLPIIVGATLAMMWVVVSTTVKRLRDARLNVWWALVLVLPFSFIASIVFGCISSKPDPQFWT